MTRNRRPTQRLIESREQNPRQVKKQIQKEKQKQVLQKKISKAQDNLIKEVSKPYDNSKELEVIRDTNNFIYKDLYVDLNEFLTKLIRLTIQEFPDNFLPPIFKGSVPIYIEKTPPVIKQTVLLSKLLNGDYQTAGSKSDKGIANGIKTLLKIPELQKYNNDDLTEFVKNHREVFYHILLKSKNEKLSLPTLKGYLVKLMRVLFLAFKTKNTPVYIKYASIMKEMMSATQQIDDKNELNENEKTRFLDWETILYEQKFFANEFRGTVNKKTVKAYNLNLDLVLLSLYTLTPPLRREVFHLQFKQQGDTVEHDYVNVRKNDVRLELNLDKKRHDPIEIECSKELADILRESYELYPRKYLFTDARKYPDMSKKLTEDTVANRLKKIFYKHNRNIGPSILRSSYATFRFDKANGRLPMTEVNEMARLMRTSAKYILSSYRKIIDNPTGAVGALVFDDHQFGTGTVINDRQIAAAPVQSTQNVTSAQSKVSTPKRTDPYKKHIENIKKKYAENEDYREKTLKQQGEYRQKVGQNVLQRRKVLSMLRNSDEYRKKVKQTTLDKYGIKPSEYMA